jgi:hypothetical protein
MSLPSVVLDFLMKTQWSTWNDAVLDLFFGVEIHSVDTCPVSSSGDLGGSESSHPTSPPPAPLAYTVTGATHPKCSALQGRWWRGISPHILSLPPLPSPPPRHLLPLGLVHGRRLNPLRGRPNLHDGGPDLCYVGSSWLVPASVVAGRAQ